MITKIKICGITNKKDALLAAKFGADFLGFILYTKSPRHIPLHQAEKIIQSIRPLFPKCKTVGVFVHPKKNELDMIVKKKIFDIIQLSGNEKKSFCSDISSIVWKTIHIKNMKSLAKMDHYLDFSAIVLDTQEKGKYGGTGRSFNFEIGKKAIKKKKKIILAGGLKAENIKEAIRIIKPWGIDVCSGTEKSPGKKDTKKLKAFFKIVKNLSL